MLKNDRINIILALIIAISLWSYVLAEVNPPTETQISDVPITFEGEDNLSAAGLVILYSDISSVDVVVKGDRSDTSKVDKKDVKATVDLTGLTEGKHILELNYEVPDSVEIVGCSSETVTIDIDKLITDSKDVVVNLTSNIVDGKEPYIVETSMETVYVTGAESTVNKVEHVAATLDVEQVGDELGSFDVPLTAVDSTGLQVKGVYTSVPTVSVSAVMLNTKTVELQVPIKDDKNADVERTYSAPKEITIKGIAADLEEITSVQAKTVYLADVFESTEIDIEPILPEGVSVSSESEGLKVSVTVVGMETGQLDYNESDIAIDGLKDNLSVSIDKSSIAVKYKGKANIIESLMKEDFTLSIDISGLDAGKHEVEIKCLTDADVKELEVKPEKVTVNIKEKSETVEDSEKAEEK